MDVKDRIKEIRSSKGLSQRAFAEKINIAAGTLAQFETGVRNVKDIHIAAICREFNINEEWLRNGTGEMFNEPKEDAISRIALEFGLDDITTTILKCYLQLDEPKRAVMREYFVSVVREYSEIHPPKETEYSDELSIDEEVEAYRRELELERRMRTSEVSPDTKNA